LKSVQRLQRRRVKYEKLTDGRTPMIADHDLVKKSFGPMIADHDLVKKI
jgi:hypothetical protein